MLRETSIPIAILSILASLLLPLPPSLIDWLLVANLLFALILLASSLYISEPIKLSALPTMLLLATLYRLALNVSTTRAILNSGHAGQVIEAFGEVVIQGNIIVGVVVFLIITLIQFLVIAKGAERVAEVAARFTLDALPGKQMSIDADVRAGLIDFETARQRRQDLQTESRFYGALDGAMKFIKGDAIAGLIITVINCIGGMVVGVSVLGLSASRAMHQFTLLTVGDGLASQIPALLNALAAGIVVTRVTRGDGQSLARELPQQLGQLRSVKVIVSMAGLALGMIPLMPFFPFVGAATLLLLSALVRSNEQEKSLPHLVFQPRTPPLLQVCLATNIGRQLQQLGNLNREFDALRQRIFDHRGLIINAPEFSVEAELGSSFEIRMRGVVAFRGTCGSDTKAALAGIVAALEAVITRRACECIDDVLTRRTLDRFDKEAPELVAAVVPGIISVTQLTEIFRCLVAEDITIRNIDLILQAVAESGARVRNERAMLEETRIGVKRIICDRFALPDGKLYAYSLASMFDLAFSACEREGKFLDALLIDDLLNDIRCRHEVGGSVIIASRAARRLLKETLRGRGMGIPVLAYEEIAEEVVVEYCGVVGAEVPRREVLMEALAA